MSQTIYQVDSFTDKAFAGNPAAVCIMDSMPEERRCINIASEMNLSETAFLVPNGNGFELRWFTPTVEVDLCGHATLAAVRVLSELGKLSDSGTVTFTSRSGRLRAKMVDDQIELDFPITTANQCECPQDIIRGIGLHPQWCGKTDFDYLVEVSSAEQVRNCQPDFGILSRFGIRGVIVTAQSDQTNYDFISRFFAPGAGIDEDPVTGSAHCALGPYWQAKLGKSELTGYQASERGGVVNVRIESDRIFLRGSAVLVMKSELFV